MSRIKLLSATGAAAYLGIDVRTFQSWIEKGAKIPSIIIGKRRRYTRERLKEWAEARDRKVI